MKSQDFPVSIVLATLNGATHLGDQIRSLQAQDHQNWQVILSDDGSHDATLEIAQNLLEARRLRCLTGPQTGLALNFWNALKHVPKGHFAAFCDQDDVWCADKLRRALTHFTEHHGAAVYSSGRYITDAELCTKCLQPRRAVDRFAPLLFRNPLAGHTCVLNPRAVQILKQFPPSSTVPFHDWWTALVLKGVGATFIHDPKPSLYYRQHASNVIGARGGRFDKLMNGTYFKWLRANHAALLEIQNHLSPEARSAVRICHLTQAGLSLGNKNQQADHVRQHQQQARRRSVID